jgi:hypothetical protein
MIVDDLRGAVALSRGSHVNSSSASGSEGTVAHFGGIIEGEESLQKWAGAQD